MHALVEAKRLLDVLEKQLPALSALDKGLKALVPELRRADQVLRQVEAQPDSPGAWAGELEGMLRSLRAAASQLRAQGASGHSATILKALTRIDALLTPLTKPAEQPPSSSKPRVPLEPGKPSALPRSITPLPLRRLPTPVPVPTVPEAREPAAALSVEAPGEWTELPMAFARPPVVSPPAPRQDPQEPYNALQDVHAFGTETTAAMRWSVGALTVVSMERQLLPVHKSPALEPEASDEQEQEPQDQEAPEASPRFPGLGPGSLNAGRAHFAEELLALHLEHLSSVFNSRMALLRSGNATGSILARLEGDFLAHADALRWMGAEAIHALAERLVSAEDAGSAFAMALPLLTLEGDDTVGVVQHAALSAAPELAAGFVEALRFALHPRLFAFLDALSSPEAPAFLRAPSLGLFVQARRWEASLVEAALRSDEPEMVAAAARAVLTAGRVEFLGSLEALLTHELEAPADVEVVVAASVLGSSGALRQARARLTQDAAPPEALIKLMAASGIPEDSELLWRLAEKKGPVAKAALWALARLGVPSALPRLRELAEKEPTIEAASEPLRFLTGTVPQPPTKGRVVHGVAWTAHVPVSLLLNPTIPSAEREWAFWELAARTGLHVAIDVHWPWQLQLQAARAWELVGQQTLHRFARGNWLYRGKLLTKGDGT